MSAASTCEAAGSPTPSGFPSVLTTSGGHVPWKRCVVCRLQTSGDIDPGPFRSARDFVRHLREYHCTREGGSYVCRYGLNGVCPSLPVEGVSDRDYEDHVAKDHANVAEANSSSSSPIRDFKGVPTAAGSSSTSSLRESSPSDALTSASKSLASAPSVVRDQHQWTVYMSRVNLPAVLNDPTLTRREVDIFQKTWGESFEKAEVKPSTRLRPISAEDFSKYLSKTSARHKRHVKYANHSQEVEDADGGREFLASRNTSRMSSELDAIPKLYQQPTFSLQNPETFNAVFPWSQIAATRHEQPGKSRPSSKLLQEKLSHYLDVVEIQISDQISHRSEAFFDAMVSHDELQDHMKRTCDVIRYLREKVRHLDHILVQQPMKILQLMQQRSNYLQVLEKLKLMATVHQTQPTIQLLLSTNDYVGALDLIATTQDVLTQELVGIQSFRHLGPQLSELEKMIDTMMHEEFVRFSAHDLNRLEDEQRTLADEERLAMIVLGSLRQHKYTFIDIYREEAVTTLKAIVKQTVIEAVAAAEDVETADASVTSLANQMRLLNFAQWLDLLQHLLSNILVTLGRVRSMTSVVHNIVKASSEQDIASVESQLLPTSAANDLESSSWQDTSPNSPLHEMDADQVLSQGEYLRVAGLLHEMLVHVCDQAHDRSLKVVVARGKDGFFERLTVAEFVQVMQIIEKFVVTSERLSGHRSTSLWANMQSQASKYVGRFHDERKNKLTLILDNERWKQADVPVEFQDLVDHISLTGQLSLPAKKGEICRQPGEFLLVDGSPYAVVGTVLMLLKIVIEYCQLITEIPSVSPEVLNRLVELLKMFNSRTCQLILGAGAVHLVGLKTISTKNLGLASRCLQLVIHYLPLLRRHFEERLNGTQLNMLKHFERVAKDYNDHISEISNKLITITDSMLEMNINKWEVKAPMPSTCFRNIVRQISKLHEGVHGLLPVPQIQEIFERIHSSFKRFIRQQLKKLGLTRDGGPQHGLVMSDIAFYVAGIRSLPGLADIDVSCDDIWDRRQ